MSLMKKTEFNFFSFPYFCVLLWWGACRKILHGGSDHSVTSFACCELLLLLFGLSPLTSEDAVSTLDKSL